MLYVRTYYLILRIWLFSLAELFTDNTDVVDCHCRSLFELLFLSMPNFRVNILKKKSPVCKFEQDVEVNYQRCSGMGGANPERVGSRSFGQSQNVTGRIMKFPSRPLQRRDVSQFLRAMHWCLTVMCFQSLTWQQWQTVTRLVLSI